MRGHASDPTWMPDVIRTNDLAAETYWERWSSWEADDRTLAGPDHRYIITRRRARSRRVAGLDRRGTSPIPCRASPAHRFALVTGGAVGADAAAARTPLPIGRARLWFRRAYCRLRDRPSRGDLACSVETGFILLARRSSPRVPRTASIFGGFTGSPVQRPRCPGERGRHRWRLGSSQGILDAYIGMQSPPTATRPTTRNCRTRPQCGTEVPMAPIVHVGPDLSTKGGSSSCVSRHRP